MGGDRCRLRDISGGGPNLRDISGEGLFSVVGSPCCCIVCGCLLGLL